MTSFADLKDFYAIKAQAFIQKHEAEYLDRDRLVASAMLYLQSECDLSDETAQKIVLRALCEHESKSTALYFDLDGSTSTMIVVVDSNRNKRHVVSTRDFAHWLSSLPLDQNARKTALITSNGRKAARY